MEQIRKNLGASLLITIVVVSMAQVQSEEAQVKQESAVRRHKSSRTAHEWHEKFRCITQASNETAVTEQQQQQQQQQQKQEHFRWPLTNIWWRIMATRCNRDPNAWRFLYINELRTSGEIIIEDATIDERLANIEASLNSHNMFDTSYSYFNSGDPKHDALNELAVAGPEVNESQCSRDLARMLELFDDLQNKLAQIRASPAGGYSGAPSEGWNSSRATTRSLRAHHIQLARVLDSFGRYESGTLDGKLRLAGDYDECEASKLQIFDERRAADHGEAEPEIRMRYCWANLNIERDLHPLLKARTRYAHETGMRNLNAGVCLPRSCHSKSFHERARMALVQRLVDSQLRSPASIYVHQTYELESVFCLVDSDSEYAKMPLSGQLCLLVTGAWALLCLSATALNRLWQSRREDEKEQKKMEKKENQGVLVQTKREAPGASFMVRLAQHLDLSQSWRDFTSDKRQANPCEAPPVVDLDALNPVKLFACTFCVVTHTTFMLGAVSSGAIKIAALVDLNKVLQVALLTSTITDTFFVISGLLITYVALKKLHRRAAQRMPVALRESAYENDAGTGFLDDDEHNDFSRRFSTVPLSGHDKIRDCERSSDRRNNDGAAGVMSFIGQWLVLASNRYLRIVPLYAMLFWFRRDVLTYLGWGPLWDYGLNKETPNGACASESWWTPFTFWSAFIPLAKQCFIPSWSISNDIFFGLFIPPILIAHTRRPKWAVASTIALIVIFILVTIVAHLAAPSGLLWELLEARTHGIVLIFTGLSHLYTWPFFRLSSFLIGSLAGYCLFRYDLRWQEKQQKEMPGSYDITLDTASNSSSSTEASRAASAAANWPKWLTRFATQMSWLYFLAHWYISHNSNELHLKYAPYHRPVSFYWLVLDRSVWSAANAVIFLRMVTDWRYNSRIVRAFAGQRWRTLAKLNFPLIFIHWLVVITFLGFLPAPATFTMWQICAAFSAVIFVSTPIATLVHVVLENPIDKLIKKEVFRF